jgi:hypothetical protein
VLLRVVDEPWPFPRHYQLASQPRSALDLLDYSDTTARRIGRARAKSGPLLGRLLGRQHQRRGPRPVVEGDPAPTPAPRRRTWSACCGPPPLRA